MKGVIKKWNTRYWAYFLGALLASCLVFCQSKCNALDFTSGSSTPLSGATVKFWYQGGYTTVPMRSVYHGNTLRMYRYNGDTTLDTTIREINFATGYAPSQASIVHFGIRISKTGNNIPLGFEGLIGNGMAILARNCMDIEDVDTANGSMTTFWQCDYWAYKEESEPGYGYGFSLAGDIYYSSGSSFIVDVLGQVDFLVLANPINASTITNVGNQITQAIEDLEDTMQAAGSGPTPAQVEAAAKSAIESAREDEKEEYEEQQENVSGGAEDAGDEADAATSSLIDTGRDIIETIRDTPATNCVIRIKRGNFDTGNLNLCDVPQQIRTMISTAIVIPVTLAALHIAYSVVMLYLNTVRKEQE